MSEPENGEAVIFTRLGTAMKRAEILHVEGDVAALEMVPVARPEFPMTPLPSRLETDEEWLSRLAEDNEPDPEALLPATMQARVDRLEAWCDECEALGLADRYDDESPTRGARSEIWDLLGKLKSGPAYSKRCTVYPGSRFPAGLQPMLQGRYLERMFEEAFGRGSVLWGC